MFKFTKFMPVALLAAVAIGFTACGDDDDDPVGSNEGGNGAAGSEPNVENVFTGGLPASVGGAAITTNADGQVTTIKNDYTTVTFEYGSFTPNRAHNYTVLMKERDAYSSTDGSDIYMELNNAGFVVYAYQVYLDGDDPDEWTFTYDKDGHMTSLVRSEGDDKYVITWNGGNITKVNETEDDGDTSDFTIAYTNAEYTSAVANKGCIMLFDDALGIDMDEMEIAYYAGLLGKATKDLPMGYTRKDVEGGSTYTENVVLHWEFNANQYPTKFWEGDDTYDAVTFAW